MSIRTASDNGVAELVLDRPQKRNALTPEMLHDLCATADAMGADDSVRAVLLRGEGEVFCAGFDLTLCRDDETVLGELLRGLSRSVRSLRRCGCPVIVCAHGAAIAGGCALLGGGDFVIADEKAKLGYPVLTLGISPAVSAPSLEMLCGLRHARERMLDPALIDGREAMRIGLVHECVSTAGEVLARGRELAAKIAKKPPNAVRVTKLWLNELDGSSDDWAFDSALRTSLGLVGGDEEKSLMASLWKGRG